MSRPSPSPSIALAAILSALSAACAGSPAAPSAAARVPPAGPAPVVTHGGTYFLWLQRPRLTWRAGLADTVMLEFRTEEPQSPASADLVLTWDHGGRYEGRSVHGVTRPGVQTARTFLDFPIPAAALAAAIRSDSLRLEVGGIRVKFEPRHRTLLAPLVDATIHAAGPVPAPATGHAGS